MPSSVPKTSLRSLLALCLTALPITLLFTRGVLAAPTPVAQDPSSAAINAGQSDVDTNDNEIFEEQIQQQQDLYATITKENDDRNEIASYLSLAKSVSEKVEKRDGNDDFLAALQQLQATYEQIEAEAEQLRTLVAQEGEILAASRQAIQ